MKKSPVALVKEQFESKEKLVAAVEKLATSDLWLDRVNSVKGLGRVSNTKLLRLHRNLTDASSRFGSRAKLVDAILSLSKRSKDAGFKQRLESFPLPRLLDQHDVLARKQKRAAAPAVKAAQPKKAAPAKAAAAPAKKAPVKKAPAKKAPAKKTSKKN